MQDILKRMVLFCKAAIEVGSTLNHFWFSDHFRHLSHDLRIIFRFLGMFLVVVFATVMETLYSLQMIGTQHCFQYTYKHFIATMG